MVTLGKCGFYKGLAENQQQQQRDYIEQPHTHRFTQQLFLIVT
jgi:hypothetical protein